MSNWTPPKMKPDTIARNTAERIAEQKRSAVGGYESYCKHAAKAYEDYLNSHVRAEREYANDWVEGANRYVERAAQVGITLAPLTPYEALPDEHD
jgi:hypothetical protein